MSTHSRNQLIHQRISYILQTTPTDHPGVPIINDSSDWSFLTFPLTPPYIKIHVTPHNQIFVLRGFILPWCALHRGELRFWPLNSIKSIFDAIERTEPRLRHQGFLWFEQTPHEFKTAIEEWVAIHQFLGVSELLIEL
jgi:hypothetical protein